MTKNATFARADRDWQVGIQQACPMMRTQAAFVAWTGPRHERATACGLRACLTYHSSKPLTTNTPWKTSLLPRRPQGSHHRHPPLGTVASWWGRSRRESGPTSGAGSPCLDQLLRLASRRGPRVVRPTHLPVPAGSRGNSERRMRPILPKSRSRIQRISVRSWRLLY